MDAIRHQNYFHADPARRIHCRNKRTEYPALHTSAYSTTANTADPPVCWQDDSHRGCQQSYTG